MTIRYFSYGMTHVRYPYHRPSEEWVDFSMVLREMGGLQYSEGPTEIILKSDDGLGIYYTHVSREGVAPQDWVCPQKLMLRYGIKS